MKRAGLLVLLGLVACAHQPSGLSPTCSLPEFPETSLLSVLEGDHRTQILVHAQARGQMLELVALNPVGARLFSAQLQDGRITALPAAHYRGPDPRLVIWGYSLWLAREQAQVCWPAEGDRLVQGLTDELLLQRGQRLLARWLPSAPAEIELPEAKLRMTLRAMD